MKNPHRVAMLKWLNDHSSPFIIDGSITPLMNYPVYANPSDRIHGIPPGYWPPWGFAMAMGDKESALALAELPGVEPVARCGVGVTDSIRRPKELGCAAIYHLKEEHIELLDHWLEKASVDLELRDRFDGVTDMIKDVLYRLNHFRSEIDRVSPTLPSSTSILQKKEQEKDHKKSVAFRMIHLILRKAFRGSANRPGRALQFKGIMNDPRYETFVRRIRWEERDGLFPGLEDLVNLIEFGPRATRSGAILGGR
ncbi:hypothetical protein N7454_000402 [Penicillium verhagenii]|nr:hypothetical protein N7454_000402 [Penicillium verhagenii]